MKFDPDLSPEVKPIDHPKRVTFHAAKILMLANLIFTVLLLTSYAIHQFNFEFERLFFIFTIIHHCLLFFDIVTSDATSRKEFYKLADFHYLTFAIYNYFVLYRPSLFYVLIYVFYYGHGFIKYSLDVLIPLSGDYDPQTVKGIHDLTDNPMILTVPVIMEIINMVIYFIQIFTRFPLGVLTFVIYFVWIVQFNYSVDPISKSVWDLIKNFFERIFPNNNSPLRKAIDSINSGISYVYRLPLGH